MLTGTLRQAKRVPPHRMSARVALLAAACVAALSAPAFTFADTRQIVMSNQATNVRVQSLAGTSPATAVVVASGTDGWRGLASALGDRLVADGYAVVGLDTKSYLVEATRQSGALAPAVVVEDYLALLRQVDVWFPDVTRVFLLGVVEGGAVALVAAADPRVGVRLAGVIGVETPGTMSLRSPYWNWTSWITHRDADAVSLSSVNYVAAVAPVPVSFIYGTPDLAVRHESVRDVFDGGGEPRRLAIIETDRGLFNDAREQLFDTVRDCLAWSTRVRRASSAQVVAVGVQAARSAP